MDITVEKALGKLDSMATLMRTDPCFNHPDDVEKGAWFWTSGASLTQDVPQWGIRGKARGPKCVRLELRAFWNILNWSSDDCQRVLNYLCEIQMPPSS